MEIKDSNEKGLREVLGVNLVIHDAVHWNLLLVLRCRRRCSRCCTSVSVSSWRSLYVTVGVRRVSHLTVGVGASWSWRRSHSRNLGKRKVAWSLEWFAWDGWFGWRSFRCHFAGWRRRSSYHWRSHRICGLDGQISLTWR